METHRAGGRVLEIPVTFTRVSQEGKSHRYKVRMGEAPASTGELFADDVPDTSTVFDALVDGIVHAADRLAKLEAWATEFTKRHLAVFPGFTQALSRTETERIWLKFFLEEGELAGLPLELLVHPVNLADRLIFLDQPRIDILRAIPQHGDRDLPAWPAPADRKKLLFVWAEPKEKVPHAEQWALLERHRAHCDIVEVGGATRDRLREALEQARDGKQPFHFIHFLAHGGRLDNGDVGLCLRGASAGDVDVLLPGELTRMLQATGARPNLVTLAVCHSASDPRRQFGALAHGLHLGGVPLVIGSQAALHFTVANVFVDRFYGGILRGEHPLHALEAFRRARGGDQENAWAVMAAYCAYKKEALEAVPFVSPRPPPDLADDVSSPPPGRWSALMTALENLPLQRQKVQKRLLDVVGESGVSSDDPLPPGVSSRLDPLLREFLPLRSWEDAAGLAMWRTSAGSLSWVIRRQVELFPEEALAPGILLLLHLDPGAAADYLRQLRPEQYPGLERLRPFLRSHHLGDHQELTGLLKPALEGGAWSDRFVRDGYLWYLNADGALQGVEGLAPVVDPDRLLDPESRLHPPRVWLRLPNTSSSGSETRHQGEFNVRWLENDPRVRLICRARFCLVYDKASECVSCRIAYQKTPQGG